MKNSLIFVTTTLLTSGSLAPLAIADSFPLQVGVYNVGSGYIQIAEQNGRLCYHGFSSRGSTVASITPDSQHSGFYRVNGLQGFLLYQESRDSLLAGSENQLSRYSANPDFSGTLSADLQACLNSSQPYFQQQQGGRGAR